MKPISKITLASAATSAAMVALTFGATSCRDFSVDGGRSALTCAASSVTTTGGAELKLMDQTKFNGRQIAQAFKPQSTVKNVESVLLGLQRVTKGFASISGGNVIVTIVADKNGVPDLQSPLGVAAVLPVSKTFSSAQAVKFTFGQPLKELTAKTTYWIVLDGSFSWSASDYIVWLGSDSATYPDGRALIYSSGSWLNPDAMSPDSTNRRSMAFQIGCL